MITILSTFVSAPGEGRWLIWRHSGLLLPVEAAKPRPLDLDLAAVEADLALRLPPAVRLPVITPRVAWTQTACAS
jgi:hypothetical protein